MTAEPAAPDGGLANDGWRESRSPADPDDRIDRFRVADAGAVRDRLARARRAFPGWRDAGLA